MNENLLIFIDNVFFNFKIDKGIESWCDMLKMVNDRYWFGDLYYIGLFCFCIIMIVCLKEMVSVGGYIDKDIYIFKIEFCIDISRLMELEKNKILEE